MGAETEAEKFQTWIERGVANGSILKTEHGFHGHPAYFVKPHHQEEPPDIFDFEEGCVKPASFDPVNRPEHYNSHPSGVECVAITEHMTCMIGSAIKYLWRHGLKAGADADQDLRKAIWCIERERLRLQKANHGK